MKNIIKGAVVVLASAVASQALALPSLPGRFEQFYAEKGIDVAPLSSKACALCHSGFFPNGGNLNGFGRDLQENVDVRAQVVDFSAIEELDSDADSFSNIVEFNAGTLPGDADSAPLAQ